MVEGLEVIYFRIISNVGGTRSSYTKAVQKTKQSNFGGARECVRASQEVLLAGHEAHSELIQKEAQGEQVGSSMILVYAEDQLMSAEDFKIIAEEVLASYGRVAKLEKRLENR